MTTLHSAAQQALEALEGNKRTHYYCEDSWYSCPQHPEGCADDAAGNECNCGANAVNVEIDAAVAALRYALAQQHTPFGYVQYVDKFGDYEFNKLKKDCRNNREAIPVYTAPQAQQAEPGT